MLSTKMSEGLKVSNDDGEDEQERRRAVVNRLRSAKVTYKKLDFVTMQRLLKKNPSDDAEKKEHEAEPYHVLYNKWEKRDRGGEKLAKEPWFRLRWWRMREHLEGTSDPEDVRRSVLFEDFSAFSPSETISRSSGTTTSLNQLPPHTPDVLITVDVDTIPNIACFDDVALHRLVDHHHVAVKDTPPMSEVNTGGLMVVRNSVWARLFLQELVETLQLFYYTPVQHPDMVATIDALNFLLKVEILAKLDLLVVDTRSSISRPAAAAASSKEEREEFDNKKWQAQLQWMSEEAGRVLDTSPTDLVAWEKAVLRKNVGQILEFMDLSECFRSYNVEAKSQYNVASCWNDQVQGLLQILNRLPTFDAAAGGTLVDGSGCRSSKNKFQKEVALARQSLVYWMQGATIRGNMRQLNAEVVTDLADMERAWPHLLTPEVRESVRKAAYPDSLLQRLPLADEHVLGKEMTTTSVKPHEENRSKAKNPESAKAVEQQEKTEKQLHQVEEESDSATAVAAGNTIAPQKSAAALVPELLAWRDIDSPFPSMSTTVKDIKRRVFMLYGFPDRFQKWLYENQEVGMPSRRQRFISEVVHFVNPRTLEINFRPAYFIHPPEDLVETIASAGIDHAGRCTTMPEGFTPMVAHWPGLRWAEKQVSMLWYMRRFNISRTVEKEWYDITAWRSFFKSSKRIPGLENVSPPDWRHLLLNVTDADGFCGKVLVANSICQPGTPLHKIPCSSSGNYLCG
ncbi:unnamed protein product [Amoebophrya sp. A25]|nr:unnamed protein product [Amoebophrya sp. A25]|eukprot:GSA25T00001960001.1